MDRRYSLSDTELDVVDSSTKKLDTLPRHSHFFSPFNHRGPTHAHSEPNLLTDNQLEPPVISIEENEEEPTFSFDNRAGLAHDLSFLAGLPELCDVTFLVGEDRHPVCGVRAVLAARSKYVSNLMLICVYENQMIFQ